MMEGLRPNKHGVFASPAIRHTLTKLHQLPTAEKNILSLSYIATNLVSSGNQDNMVQALRKLFNATVSAGDSSPLPKKAKRQSSNKAETSTDSALIASSTTVTRPTKLKRSGSEQPEKCKQCGKFVIHTDGICDVYNVPVVHMASSGMSDTQNYSVVFQDTNFDDHEYMFANDLGIVDHLTLDKYLNVVIEINTVHILSSRLITVKVPRET